MDIVGDSTLRVLRRVGDRAQRQSNHQLSCLSGTRLIPPLRVRSVDMSIHAPRRAASPGEAGTTLPTAPADTAAATVSTEAIPATQHVSPNPRSTPAAVNQHECASHKRSPEVSQRASAYPMLPIRTAKFSAHAGEAKRVQITWKYPSSFRMRAGQSGRSEASFLIFA